MYVCVCMRGCARTHKHATPRPPPEISSRRVIGRSDRGGSGGYWERGWEGTEGGPTRVEQLVAGQKSIKQHITALFLSISTIVLGRKSDKAFKLRTHSA